MTAPPRIFGFGQADGKGLYIDVLNEPAAYVLTPKEGHFVIQPGIIPEIPSGGVIPNKDVVRFQIEAVNATKHITNEDQRLKLVFEYRDNRGRRIKLDIGILEDYRRAKSWIEDANVFVRSKRSGEEVSNKINERYKIIIQTGHLHILPCVSLSSTPEAEYRSHWMEFFENHCRNIIASVTNKRIDPRWYHWPGTDQTWDKVFSRVLLPMNGGAWSDDRVDICFEPFYLDQDREDVLGYSVARFGSLPHFAFGLDALRYGFQPRLFDQGIRTWEEICQYFRENEGSRPVLGFLIGTPAGDFLYREVKLQNWPTDFYKPQDTVLKFAEWLLDKSVDERRGGVADIGIFELVKTEQARQDSVGDLRLVRVPYHSEIRVGMPYDRRDVIWGGVLEDCLIEVRQSSANDPRVISSWNETKQRLRKIGIVPDEMLTR